MMGQKVDEALTTGWGKRRQRGPGAWRRADKGRAGRATNERAKDWRSGGRVRGEGDGEGDKRTTGRERRDPTEGDAREGEEVQLVDAAVGQLRSEGSTRADNQDKRGRQGRGAASSAAGEKRGATNN